MNDDVRMALRRNWILAGVCLLCLGVGLVAAIRSCGGSAEAPATRALADSPSDRALRQALEAPPIRRQSPQEETQETLKAYQEKVDANPQSPETPAYLSAMGNLYRQKLQDYDQAAQCYVRIVLDFPDWEGAYMVYPQLISCYEQKGDQKNINWLCQLMMKRFPEDSQEYLFAKDKLGI